MLNILLSERTADALSASIAEVLSARPYRLLAPDVPAHRTLANAAFISRDVTGASTKTRILPSTSAFYDCMRASPRLEWVHVHSAGADRPIFPELMARGVRVTTSSGATAPVVAQTALGALLSLARRFPALAAAQRNRVWQPLLASAPPSLVGQTALIVGYGPIGQRLQRHLRMLEMNVIVARRQASIGADDAQDDGVVAIEDLHRVLPKCDWLILACPLTPTTRGLIDAEALSRLPSHAHLINVARGEVVVENDLIDALQAGSIAGAFLDVFTQEPLDSGSPLWALPNVIVSPHSAGHASNNEAAVARIWLDNLGRWSRSEPLINEVIA